MSRNESIPEPIAGMATDINFLLSAAANALVTTPLRSYKFLSPPNTCVTTAGNLSHYQCVVHVCSPIWTDRKTIEDFKYDLSGVVTNALVAADSRKMKSVAIPAIGSGYN
jgi:hypothetical protein